MTNVPPGNAARCVDIAVSSSYKNFLGSLPLCPGPSGGPRQSPCQPPALPMTPADPERPARGRTETGSTSAPQGGTSGRGSSTRAQGLPPPPACRPPAGRVLRARKTWAAGPSPSRRQTPRRRKRVVCSGTRGALVTASCSLCHGRRQPWPSGHRPSSGPPCQRSSTQPSATPAGHPGPHPPRPPQRAPCQRSGATSGCWRGV